MEEEKVGGGTVGPRPICRSNDPISKKFIRNKSLSISFDDKDLKDFVGGFQKRKKKRRKEALKKQENAERRKRLEVRKQRRKEKEYALYGEDGAPPEDSEASDDDPEQEDDPELNPSVSGTTTYENGEVMVTVTTSELTHEEEKKEHRIPAKSPPPVSVGGAGKQHKIQIPVSKKKAFKKPRKGSSRPKLQSKRERRKGNKKKA